MKREQLFHKHFLFALFVSMFFHLVFITTVEAALWLGKVFHADPQSIFFTFRRPLPPPASSKSKVLASKPIEISKTSSVEEKPPQTKESKKRTTPVIQKSVKRFKRNQTFLDERIQKFQHDLKTLTTEIQNQTSIESLTSQVSDLEKVPLELQEFILPAYLKAMRVKIVERWSRLIADENMSSGDATVEYRIDLDGKVSRLSLISGIKNAPFETTCLKAVQEASPFGELPFQFDRTETNPYLTLSLTFHLRKDDRGSLKDLNLA
ncbi:MAG: TonB C-terminal domain-containing protein [Candidatus Omnitrophica bacterium]|nr:TonB C-terminal domain-containing protein [Candidatus Omnitrophota bacterium]